MGYVAAAVIGYLLGSIPVSLVVARAHGVDLYRTSDGNPGAWNALEQLGARRAWPAFAGDGVKGTLAGLAGLAMAGTWGAYAGVAAAMLGHGFPSLQVSAAGSR
jgi:glycerol-3-phosphate acyltransferase PlsY